MTKYFYLKQKNNTNSIEIFLGGVQLPSYLGAVPGTNRLNYKNRFFGFGSVFDFQNLVASSMTATQCRTSAAAGFFTCNYQSFSCL